jgi:hypothetical protein
VAELVELEAVDLVLRREEISDELLANELLADELLANELLADELLADELLADELLPDELLPDELPADELLADELLADELLAERLTLRTDREQREVVVGTRGRGEGDEQPTALRDQAVLPGPSQLEEVLIVGAVEEGQVAAVGLQEQARRLEGGVLGIEDGREGVVGLALVLVAGEDGEVEGIAATRAVVVGDRERAGGARGPCGDGERRSHDAAGEGRLRGGVDRRRAGRDPSDVEQGGVGVEPAAVEVGADQAGCRAGKDLDVGGVDHGRSVLDVKEGEQQLGLGLLVTNGVTRGGGRRRAAGVGDGELDGVCALFWWDEDRELVGRGDGVTDRTCHPPGPGGDVLIRVDGGVD